MYRTIVWQIIVLVLGFFAIFTIREYLLDQNTLIAEKARIDCLIRSSDIDDNQFGRGNCYEITKYRNNFFGRNELIK